MTGCALLALFRLSSSCVCSLPRPARFETSPVVVEARGSFWLVVWLLFVLVSRDKHLACPVTNRPTDCVFYA